MAELLQELITDQAEQRPEAVAVVFKGVRMSYGEIEHASNRLARLLRKSGCRRGDRVCLLLPRSLAAIVGLLGIYKADCVYVPLDPASPAARLAKIVHSSEPGAILAGGPMAPLVDELLADEHIRASLSVGWLDGAPEAGANFRPAFSWRDLASYPETPLDYQNRPEDPAHILYTSGSTGTPKGVIITHGNVMPFVRWAIRYFGITSSDRNSAHSPPHFDLSVLDIFGTFGAGAQLHLVPPELHVLPNALAELIRTHELTQWFSVPSLLNYMAKLDVVQFNDFPALRRVLWCGEVFQTSALIYWMTRLPHVRFTNLYGPTETTIASSYYTMPKCPEDERAAIPIGSACEGEELLVLDEALRPVPPGQVGDLYIRGVGLSPGYWKDPKRTAAVFLQNPLVADPTDRIYKTGDLARVGEDGLVYFVGRADSQIKSRGYRIELGEIEAALSAIPWLRESAAVAIPTDGFEGILICCAYAPVPAAGATPAAVRRELSKLLPRYMLPARWMALERLPQNANGKIDRRRLKEQFEQHEAQAH